MSKPKLTYQDFEKAAQRLRCEIPAIRAVDEVESRGEGFYDNGFPTILYERHIFYKYCDRDNRAEWARQYPKICNKVSGGYGAVGQNQRDKFSLAFSLDPIAAMKSCSWGRYQIMGFNFGMCGFDSVGAFVDAMKVSEGEHLLAFVGFVRAAGLADELRNHEWASFARGYNGTGYAKNKYDIKMATAYKKFANQKVSAADTLNIPAKQPSEGATANPTEPTTENQPPIDIETKTVETKDTAEGTTQKTTTTEETSGAEVVNAPPSDGSTATSVKTTILGVTLPPVIAIIVKAISDLIEKGFIGAKEIGDFVMNLVTQNLSYVFILIGLIIVGLMLRKAYKQISFFLQMWFAASKDKNNVEVKPQ